MTTTSWNVNAREFTPGDTPVIESAPKLRVDAPEFVPEEFVPLSKSKSITLHEQLFGDMDEPAPVVPVPFSVPQHISPVLVQQLLVQADKQVLELGSFLATKGTVTSAQDLILIRLQLQQLQCLKTSLNAVLNPLPTIGNQPIVPRVVAPSSGYASLLAQAATYVKKSNALKLPVSSRTVTASSTAVTTAAPSPRSGQLTVSDLGTLVYRVIEKLCVPTSEGPCLFGVPTSALKDEWIKCYPSLSPLAFYMDMFRVTQVKDLLSPNKNLVLFYASLPSVHMRVATRPFFDRSFDPKHPSAKLVNFITSPLISPTSTCSYTSVDHEMPVGVAPEQPGRQLTELILKIVRSDQLEFLRSKNCSILVELLESIDLRGKRLLDSKRPPPIDTSRDRVVSSGEDTAKLFAQFRLLAARQLKKSSAVDLSKLEALWKSEIKTPFPESLANIPGITLLENGTQCVLTAMTILPNSVDGLFLLSDSAVWKNNDRLLQLMKNFVNNVPPPISQLSSLLFKSITSGGSATECAAALKVLAAKNPSAIHEIVASHLAQLKNGPSAAAAASAFVTTLIQRGKELKPNTFTRDELLMIRKEMAK